MPNYWDSIKQAISNAVGSALGITPQTSLSLGAGLAQGSVGRSGYNVDLSTIADKPKTEIADLSSKIGSTAVGTVTKPAEIIKLDTALNLGLEQVDKFYQWAYPKISQPISTTALVSADVVAGEGLNLVENWKLAKNVSPGQAIVAPYVELFNPEFDIASPSDRKKTFTDNVFGKLTSGGLDGLVNWFADPLVIGGKALKAARIAGFIRPIESAEDIVRLRSELDIHGLYVKSNGVVGRETPMGVVAQRLVGKNAAEAADDIFIRKTTNPFLMAGLVGEANTYDDVANFIGGKTQYIPAREGECRFTLADNTKIKKYLKWSPKVSLEQWISKHK